LELAFNNPGEYMRVMDHVDVVVGTIHAKERVPNPQIL
jgi:hypothetical protein